MKRVRGMHLSIVLMTLLGASVLTTVVPLSQRQGARSSVPKVVRRDYDMGKLVAPSPLGEIELKGRRLYSQRCAHCHGGTARNPGPRLDQETIKRVGEAAAQEK